MPVADRRTGRTVPPPRLVAALAVLVLAAGSLAGLVAGPGPPAVPGPLQVPAVASVVGAEAGTGADTPRVVALRRTLDERASALLARDAPGWTAPLAGTEHLERQRAVFDRLGAVPLASWRWEYLGVGAALPHARAAELSRAAALTGAGPSGAGRAVAGAQAAPGAEGTVAGAGRARPWVAHVALVYRLDGAASEVRRDQYLTMVPHGSSWRVADDRDGPTARDLWDLGPVSVAEGERSLVLGTGDVGAWPDLVDAAAARVDDAWGPGWPRTTVVEVPATQDQTAALLARPDVAGLDRVAAVTTGESSAGAVATTGDRVVVNPAGMAALTPLGREVVLTHELTHVAVRSSATATVPRWLSEGYADWVGYRASGLDEATIASPLLARATRGLDAGASLASLPGASAFDPARGDVAGAYAGSWLAVDLLARRWGDDAVTALYRDVSAPGAGDSLPAAGGSAAQRVDRALRERTGTGVDELTRRWRERALLLADDAGVPGGPVGKPPGGFPAGSATGPGADPATEPAPEGRG